MKRTPLALFAGWLIAATSVSAQSTTPATPGEQPVVTLSPFEVDASKDIGYQAESTLSGSRLNSSLWDVPANISVFTQEFIEDMAVNSLEELALFDANTQVDLLDTQGADNSNAFDSPSPNARTFISRGMEGGISRDFESSLSPQDTYNISRADLSKGPNGVLFGLGGAGGVINVSTNRANFNRNTNSVQLQLGSWDLRRVVLDFNRVLIPNKLGMRVMLLDHNQEGYRYNAFNDQRRGTATIGYRPNDRINLRVEYEKGVSQRSNLRPFGLSDAVSEWVGEGKPIAALNNSFALVPQPTRGISVRAAGTRVIYVDNAGAAYNIARSAEATTYNDNRNDANYRANYVGRRLHNDPALGELYISDRVGPEGPDSLSENRFDSLKLGAEFRITNDLALDLGFTLERGDTLGQSPNAVTLKADPNAYIGGVQAGATGTANPFHPNNRLGDNPYAGQFFMENDWRKSEAYDEQKVMRASLAYNLDLESRFRDTWARWLGSHTVGVHLQRKISYSDSVRSQAVLPREITTSGLIPGVNPNSPEAGPNIVTRRNYVQMGDWENFHTGRFPHDMTMYLPQLDRTVELAWVPQGEAFIRMSEVTQDSTIFAMQNRFWNGRIVTTFGYRGHKNLTTEAVTRRDNPATNPGGVSDINNNGMEMEWLVFPDEPWDEFEQEGIMRTQGIVVHVHKNISAFFNRSTGLQLPTLNQVVPPDGELSEGRRGTTDDFGIRFRLMENRLGGGITIFKSAELNRFFAGGQSPGTQGFVNTGLDVLSRVVDSSGNPLLSTDEADRLRPNFGGGVGDMTSDGFELALTGEITRNLSVRMTYTDTKATMTNVMRDHEAYFEDRKALFERKLAEVGATIYDKETPDGQSLRLSGDAEEDEIGETIGERYGDVVNTLALRRADREFGWGQQPKKFSGTMRYAFSQGRLRGLSTGATVRWRAAKPIANIVEYNDVNGNFQIDDGELPVDENGRSVINRLGVIGGEEDLSVDFFATYRFRNFLGMKQNSSIQLNVYNLLNDHGVVKNRLTNSLEGLQNFSFRDPINFRVTFRTEF